MSCPKVVKASRVEEIYYYCEDVCEKGTVTHVVTLIDNDRRVTIRPRPEYRDKVIELLCNNVDEIKIIGSDIVVTNVRKMVNIKPDYFEWMLVEGIIKKKYVSRPCRLYDDTTVYVACEIWILD